MYTNIRRWNEAESTIAQEPYKARVLANFTVEQLRKRGPKAPLWPPCAPQRARQAQMLLGLPESTWPSFQMASQSSLSMPGSTRS